MTQMGPEALLMTSAIASCRKLTQAAGVEYSRADAGPVQSRLLADFEEMPARRSISSGILRQGVRWFLRADKAASGSRAATSLAALPAIQASRRAERASPLSALPTLGRT